LVGLLGGKIWIESEQEDISGGRNGGTTFYFSFPIKMAENAFQKQVPIGEAREYHFNDKTILVVEDDPYNTAYLKEILSDTGLNVIITEYGHEAVRLTESLNPDLVLMDIRLPDMDGNELARKIKQIKPDLRIIAQTAYAAYDDKQKAFEAGCIDYISKPFKRELLLSMIFKYLPVH
jgi:CheY-like chemotaxis protein